MKKFKKILALALSLAMVLGMSATTLAAGRRDDLSSDVNSKDVTGTAEDKGTITVKGIAKEEGVTVYAYQIVKADYSGTGGKFTSNYIPLYDDLEKEDSEGELDPAKLEDPDVLSSLGLTLSAEDAELSSDADEDFDRTEMAWDDEADGYKLTEVPVGSYLVVVEGAETNFYTPVIVSVSYVAVSDSNTAGSGIQSDTLTLQDGNAWVKVSTTPVVTKTSTTVNGKLEEQSDANVDGSSVKIGEPIDYQVVVDPIPAYDGENPRFELVDTLSAGMEFIKATGATVPDVKVYVGIGEEKKELSTEYYTLTHTKTINGNEKLSLNFVKESANGKKSYTLNTPLDDGTVLSGKKLIVTYQAKVVSVNNINSTAKENGVVLNYTRDSHLTEEDGNETTPEEKTYNYTFDLSTEVNGSITESILNKAGEESTTSKTTKLPGAVFTLYTDETANTEYENGAEVTGLVNKTETVIFDGTHATSTDDGKLIITGLAAGTYYLKETAAPAGYSLNPTVFTIEIKAEYYDADEGEHKAGQLKNWTIKITDPSAEEETKAELEAGTEFKGTASVTIQNTTLASLPSTGGIGTTIFTVGGCAIMILAAALYFASRRKTAK